MVPIELDDGLETVPPALRPALRGILGDPSFRGAVTAEQTERLAADSGLSVADLMLALLPVAALYSVAPISRFAVGAVARGADTGALYFGTNMEFVGQALGFSVHGEQAAVNNAWTNGETGIVSLAVSAAPCGHCRQFLYETTAAAALDILLPGRKPMPLTHYLPDAFGPNDLEIDGALLTPEDHGLTLETFDPVVLAALGAANASYAPYTGTYAGVALEFQNGAIHAGRYAENAAFNPSLLPLQSALSLARLGGEDLSTITRCVLAGVAGAADVRDATIAVLSSAAPGVGLEAVEVVDGSA